MKFSKSARGVKLQVRLSGGDLSTSAKLERANRVVAYLDRTHDKFMVSMKKSEHLEPRAGVLVGPVVVRRA